MTISSVVQEELCSIWSVCGPRPGQVGPAQADFTAISDNSSLHAWEKCNVLKLQGLHGVSAWFPFFNHPQSLKGHLCYACKKQQHYLFIYLLLYIIDRFPQFVLICVCYLERECLRCSSSPCLKEDTPDEIKAFVWPAQLTAWQHRADVRGVMLGSVGEERSLVKTHHHLHLTGMPPPTVLLTAPEATSSFINSVCSILPSHLGAN